MIAWLINQINQRNTISSFFPRASKYGKQILFRLNIPVDRIPKVKCLGRVTYIILNKFYILEHFRLNFHVRNVGPVKSVGIPNSESTFGPKYLR